MASWRWINVLGFLTLTLGACDPSPTTDSGGDTATGGGGDTDVGAGGDVAGSPGDSVPPGDLDPPVDCAEPFTWPLPTAPIAITPDASWQNSIGVNDPFLTSPTSPGQPRWVKFVVLVADPTTVYFQDGGLYPFHADFVSARLDPWAGLSATQVNDLSLYEEGQELILGALLFPPAPGWGGVELAEVGVQLVRQDSYHPEMVRAVLELVRASLTDLPAPDLFYFPTFAQEAAANACAGWLAAEGITVSSAQRWIDGDGCYAEGWALGRFTEVSGANISAAYQNGTLLPTDVLVTDSVPAEIPYVAGVITRNPATPNSHVALLAQSYGVPFGHARRPATAAKLDSLVGHEAVLIVERDWDGNCAVRLMDVDGRLDGPTRAAILALKVPPAVAYVPAASGCALSASTDDLGPADVGCFGGKAANFGLLRDAIPTRSPEAVAFSFALWDAFMSQASLGGGSLGASIAGRLNGYAFPPDFAALAVELAAIRAEIRDGIVTAAERDAINAALAGFDPERRLRFRSSTNVEDSVTFTGAGLYDSYSGCLADDLDGDDVGPSRCYPFPANERSAYRAVAKVFASFYNDNAFLERLRRGVDESEVGMAILVHHSFPDDTELANGVGTFQANGGSSAQASLVSQPGAESVANPSLAAQPEIVDVSRFSFGTYPTLMQGAELLPIGAYVLTWDAEYVALTDDFDLVAGAFEAATGTARPYRLDFEYKKIDPDGLVIKQVRQLPMPSTTPTVETFLIDEEVDLCLVQGEAGGTEMSVFAHHRGKMVWDVSTRNLALTDTAIQSSLFADGSLDFLGDQQIESLSGAPESWPGASHEVLATDRVADSWTWGTGPEQRTYRVELTLVRLVRPNESPLVSLRDSWIYGSIDYASPQPVIDYWGDVTTTTRDAYSIEICRQPGPLPAGSVYREITFDSASAVTVTTRFWHPPNPMMAAGYTAPLEAWELTTLSGLTTDPIELVGYYSQTYAPTHHNFEEVFLFEPALEPGIPPAQLDELIAADVRRVWAFSTFGTTELRVQALDGSIRDL